MVEEPVPELVVGICAGAAERADEEVDAEGEVAADGGGVGA